MNLNELRDEAYSIAKANGWHEEERSDSHWLMLIITEIAEAVQADRKGHHSRVERFIEDMSDKDNADGDLWFRLTFAQNIENTVESELADIVIRLLDFAGLRGIPLDDANKILDEGLEETTIPLPVFMSQTCADIANENYTVARIVNEIIASIIAYRRNKGVDIEFFIRTKMKYNHLRGYHHGGQRY